MRIAFCVEGSADRALIRGLRDRWCPGAELVEGRSRGQFRRGQIPNECRVLVAKGADLIVFLRDANLENWRDVLNEDRRKCPSEYGHRVVFGICDRNVECWLAADVDHLAAHLGHPRERFVGEDPSPAVKKAFGLIGFDKEASESRVAEYVLTAPLGRWLKNSSFEDFYQQLWLKSKEMQCPGIENLRERKL